MSRMNWAGQVIGIVLTAQALSAALAQASSVPKALCDEAAEGCETDSDFPGNRGESVPKPTRKPAPGVETNPSGKTENQFSNSRMETNAAGSPDPACQGELRAFGGEFSVPDEMPNSGECWVSDPVQLTAIATSLGVIEFPGKPILRCGFAVQFSIWASHIAAPVVAGLSEAKLAAISTGPGYECRNRSGDSSGKISEHAFGNAIDIDGLVLSNGQRIEIADALSGENANHRVLMALRMSACGYFTTVLGPGSNAAHESHFHFDLGRHGKSGDYRICE
jgi:hypothetical protein